MKPRVRPNPRQKVNGSARLLMAGGILCGVLCGVLRVLAGVAFCATLGATVWFILHGYPVVVCFLVALAGILQIVLFLCLAEFVHARTNAHVEHKVMTSEHEKLFKVISKGATRAVAKYLRDHPVDVNAITLGLMLACDAEYFDIVRLLVESGADVNYKEPNGWSPLHTAVATAIDSDCKHKLGRRVADAPVDIVVYLLWKGADPFAKTNEGQTPADIAREVTSAKLVNLLETYERIHNKTDEDDG